MAARTESIGGAVEILLVEDNPGDARLAMEALREAKVTNHLTVMPDGEEAWMYLRRQGRYANAPRPDLVLLDLNLPKMDGREVLKRIKSDPALRTIPVVILTTSKAEEDVLRSYDLQANCYVSKPLDLDRFLQVIRSLEDFWFTVVRRPPHQG